MALAKHTEELLEDLAESLQIPPSRYEAAERSYQSVGEWLHRETSCLRDADPQVYVQGSFRLGTAIRPVSESEDYDVDLVCELSLSKARFTQAEVKVALGRELRGYATAHRMDPPEEGRRCWTQHYADGAQFHLDTLPALPDGARQRLLLERGGFSTAWSDAAIAITDREHPRYRQHCEDWPRSNPKGYADWFRSRMAAVFEARREAMALEARASVEDIPEYRVRTPLQSAIQILKRHRDIMFVDRPDHKPISVILTTLAAHAYQEETTIAGALYSILERMEGFIEERLGVTWIANPTDPTENFADRWQEYPERREAFFEWLRSAREDFAAAAHASDRASAEAALRPRLGGRLMESAARRRKPTGTRTLNGVRRSGGRLNAGHRQAPPWNAVDQGRVQVERAIVTRNGFRPTALADNGAPIPKGCGLRFEAKTNVPKPYRLYWQVVNTGAEATAAHDLRGGFDEGMVSAGRLTRDESARYAGTHSIECFIVKDGYLAARSGQFLVNIQ